MRCFKTKCKICVTMHAICIRMLINFQFLEKLLSFLFIHKISGILTSDAVGIATNTFTRTLYIVKCTLDQVSCKNRLY